MITQTEVVLKSLVDAYNTIKTLSDRINQIENNLPWETKTTEVSYTQPAPEPTPAIRQLANGMIGQMAPITKNISKMALQKIYETHDTLVIWRNGIVTTMTDSKDNPVCVFRSRASARMALRKLGYNVPYSLINRNKYSPEGDPSRSFIIATKI
jgi:hypothetical protein